MMQDKIKAALINTAVIPNITSVPCNAGNGMMASLFPAISRACSILRNITNATKQMFQIKVIFEKKRMRTIDFKFVTRFCR